MYADDTTVNTRTLKNQGDMRLADGVSSNLDLTAETGLEILNA